MTLVSYLKGAIIAKRLSRCIASMTTEVINYLVQNGVDIRLPHTTAIFKDIYAYCLFVSYKPRQKNEQIGATIERSKEYLSQWLLEIFQPSDRSFNFRPGIESTMQSISQHFSIWTEALGKGNQALLGQRVELWIPSAKKKLVEDIELTLMSDFAILPQDLRRVVSSLAEECTKNLGGWKRT